MNIKGTCEDKFIKVKELFDELHNTDRERTYLYSIEIFFVFLILQFIKMGRI